MKQPVQAPGGSQPTPRPNNVTSNPHAQQQQQHHRGQQQEQPIRAQQALFYQCVNTVLCVLEQMQAIVGMTLD